MKFYEVQDRNQPLLDVLLEIWEQSARATHLFLSDAEVKAIRAYVPQALKSVEHLIVAETEKPIGFMGIQNRRLEMLFLAPEERGKGLGKQLLQHGIETYGIVELTINEQNPQVIGSLNKKLPRFCVRIVRLKNSKNHQFFQNRPPNLYRRRLGLHKSCTQFGTQDSNPNIY